jgi:hypothetical protein
MKAAPGAQKAEEKEEEKEGATDLQRQTNIKELAFLFKPFFA